MAAPSVTLVCAELGHFAGKRLKGVLRAAGFRSKPLVGGTGMTAKMERRRLIGALGAAALTPLAAPLARPARAAEAWPVRPVTVLCPFAAGTSADTLMRMVNASLGKKFGQNFIVEDRPGATGNIAAGAAARATPDGYTLLIGTVGPIVNNKFLYKHLDSIRIAPSRRSRRSPIRRSSLSAAPSCR